MKQRGQPASYPIKLFYTSNMPVILQTALVSNIYFFSQFFHNRAPNNIFVRLFGVWKDEGGHSAPTGGFAYYISPPQKLAEVSVRGWARVLYRTCQQPAPADSLVPSCVFPSSCWGDS